MIFTLVEVRSGLEKPNFPSSSYWTKIGHENYIEETLKDQISFIINTMNFICETSSDLAIQSIDRLKVMCGEYGIPRGRGPVKLPSSLRNKKGLLVPNVQDSPFCFHICILAALFNDEIKAETDANSKTKTKNKRSIAKSFNRKLANIKTYDNYFERVNFQDINLEGKGVSLLDIEKFEENNENIAVTVYKVRNGNPIQIRFTKKESCQVVPIILVEEEHKKPGHYILIQSLSTFLSTRTAKSKVVCPFCSKSFKSKQASMNHVCGLTSQKQIIPPQKKMYRFDRVEMTLRQTHVIYFYFHRVRIKDETQMHAVRQILSGYSLILLTPKGIERQESYFGDDPITHFLNQALSIANECITEIKSTNNFIPPNEEEIEIFRSATHCDHCNSKFDSGKHRKILHHHHGYGKVAIKKSEFTPKRILCNACNLKAKTPNYICAVTFGETAKDLNLIAVGIENCKATKAFPIHRKNGEIVGLVLDNCLRVINAENFRVNASLKSLALEMLSAGEQFPFTEEQYLTKYLKISKMDAKFLEDPFPFPIFKCETDFRKLMKEEFDSNKLMLPEISEFQRKMFKKLKIKTFIEYAVHSSLLNSFLLCDYFEFHRKVSMDYYELDPLYAYTGSRFTFDSCMNYSKCKLEIITNPKIAKLVTAGIKPGTVILASKKADANTQRYGSYDPKQLTCNIFHGDFNSQYSHGLCMNLPVDQFELLTEEEIKCLDIASINPDLGIGYILEVEAKIPKDLHDKFSGPTFPPISEKRTVKFEMLSEDQQDRILNSNRRIRLNSTRVLSTLYDKTSTVHYYKNLQFFLKLGIQLKILSGFKFREAPIFKGYGEFNVNKRRESKTELLGNYFKGQNNFAVGRFAIDPMTYYRSKFCKSAADFKKKFSQHDFQDVERITEDFTMFSFKKTKGIDINFRVIALTIYELGKLELLEALHSHLFPLFKSSMRIHYTHTDSLIFSVTGIPDEIYIEKLKSISHLLDTSKLPDTHPLYSLQNAQKLGKLKFTDGISQFIGLRASCYSLLMCDNTEICKYSGIPQARNQHILKHEQYVKTLEDRCEEKAEINSIKLIDNEILEVIVERKGLDALCIDRHYYDDYDSVPLGHYKLAV